MSKEKLNKWPFEKLSGEEQLEMWPKHLVRKGVFQDIETATAFCQLGILAGCKDIQPGDDGDDLIAMQKFAKSLPSFKGVIPNE